MSQQPPMTLARAMELADTLTPAPADAHQALLTLRRAIQMLQRDRQRNKADKALLDAAVKVADHAARSDVELYARAIGPRNSARYRLDQPAVCLANEDTDWLQIVDQAMHYIALRGEALPYKTIRDRPNDEFECVMFEDAIAV